MLFCSKKLINDFGKSGLINCRRCPMKVECPNGSQLLTLQHAISHLNKPLFHCKVGSCSKTFKNSYDLGFHFHYLHKGAHRVKGESYVDNSHLYHQEIGDMLTNCFDWNEGQNDLTMLSFTMVSSSVSSKSKNDSKLDEKVKKAKERRKSTPKKSIIKFSCITKSANGEFECLEASCDFKTKLEFWFLAHMHLKHNIDFAA